jgi:hypothetical protein
MRWTGIHRNDWQTHLLCYMRSIFSIASPIPGGLVVNYFMPSPAEKMEPCQNCQNCQKGVMASQHLLLPYLL